ncbi:30S ribosomal protein S4p (S9e) [Candidatus Nasuia deltocephalinicola]|nr:30S ribosomal protein S4p (S9e) [Candidatus Nasuia deltocephalinicola]
MSKYLKPRYKIYRKENSDLFLKNRFIPCFANFENIKKKNTEYLPSHFFFQLKEKQKLKIIYGVLEKQLKIYYNIAKKMSGRIADNLIKILESRLDNIVYRMGIGFTRSDSRQIINHNYILVNNVLVNIPSYLVKIGDIIKVKFNCINKIRVIKSFNMFFKKNNYHNWIFIDFKNFRCYLKRYPDMYELDICVNQNLVLDFYSR